MHKKVNVKEMVHAVVTQCSSPVINHMQADLLWTRQHVRHLCISSPTEAGALSRKIVFLFSFEQHSPHPVYCLSIFLPQQMLSRRGVMIPQSSCIHGLGQAKLTKVTKSMTFQKGFINNGACFKIH